MGFIIVQWSIFLLCFDISFLFWSLFPFLLFIRIFSFHLCPIFLFSFDKVITPLVLYDNFEYQLGLEVGQELVQKCTISTQDQRFACLIEEILSCVEDLYETHRVIMISCGPSQVGRILPVNLLLNYSSSWVKLQVWRYILPFFSYSPTTFSLASWFLWQDCWELKDLHELSHHLMEYCTKAKDNFREVHLPIGAFALCIFKLVIHCACWYEDGEVAPLIILVISSFLFELLSLIVDCVWINQSIFEDGGLQVHRERTIVGVGEHLLMWNWQDWYDILRLLPTGKHIYFWHSPDTFREVGKLHE